MSKKKVKAKARKDKYYQLAKETGYRARSAFKLLQLNKKFGFLQSSQVLVDLCAAPGGWLQVASEHMPMSSIIIGVDLVSIRPIPRCITFQDDITKESCRNQIRTELHKWKVDCFLNDGAPNVGKNWLHDAYSQTVLALHAVKLACEFLRKGGWFITKVFRSKDYQSLMWVFNQLFSKVHATKPQASRNVSAEIFVVCQGYKAPDKIDNKFFDPKAVFQDVEGKAREVNILDFEPKKKKKKAKGYDGERDLLFQRKSVAEFLQCSEPLKMLSEVNELVFENEDEKVHPLVTKDIIENIKDIKCLGKKEIKGLWNWHRKQKKENQAEQPEEEVVSEAELDSEEEIDRQLQEIEEEETKTLKKKKKTVLKEKNKLRERMSNMAQATAIQEDMELFALDKISSLNDIDEIADDADADEALDSEAEDISSEEEEDSDNDESDKQEEDESDGEMTAQSKVWFSKDIFRQIEEEQNEDDEVANAETYYKKKNKKTEAPAPEAVSSTNKEQYNSDSDSDSDIEDVPTADVPKNASKVDQRLDAEGLALGTVIATSRKRKRDVVDDSFNRYTFNDDESELPDWFVEDEKKYIQRNFLRKHVSKDLVSFYKLKEMKINDRTIKKVAEAKARKKRKQMKKTEKARKQAEGITDSQDMSNKEKAAHVKNIYKKAGLLGKQKENTTYVFARKGAGKNVRRPPGVSGKFKVVDKRLKKDLRFNKRGNKKTGRR